MSYYTYHSFSSVETFLKKTIFNKTKIDILIILWLSDSHTKFFLFNLQTLEWLINFIMILYYSFTSLYRRRVRAIIAYNFVSPEQVLIESSCKPLKYDFNVSWKLFIWTVSDWQLQDTRQLFFFYINILYLLKYQIAPNQTR